MNYKIFPVIHKVTRLPNYTQTARVLNIRPDRYPDLRNVVIQKRRYLIGRITAKKHTFCKYTMKTWRLMYTTYFNSRERSVSLLDQSSMKINIVVFGRASSRVKNKPLVARELEIYQIWHSSHLLKLITKRNNSFICGYNAVL